MASWHSQMAPSGLSGGRAAAAGVVGGAVVVVVVGVGPEGARGRVGRALVLTTVTAAAGSRWRAHPPRTLGRMGAPYWISPAAAGPTLPLPQPQPQPHLQQAHLRRHVPGLPHGVLVRGREAGVGGGGAVGGTEDPLRQQEVPEERGHQQVLPEQLLEQCAGQHVPGDGVCVGEGWRWGEGKGGGA